MKVSDTRADGPRDKLTVPAAGDIVGNIAFLVCDVATDFEGVLATPATRLEGEDTLVASAMIGNLVYISANIFSAPPP